MTTLEKQRAFQAAVQTRARVSLAHVAGIHLAKAREALRSEEGA